jgi:hypothetical protein
MTGSSTGFDRLRSRTANASLSGPRASDPQGRRSLYSVADQAPALGAVTVDCSSCGRTSTVTPFRLLGLAAVSLHLPLLKRGHSSWMRCPACDRHAWVRLSIRL